MTSTVTTSGRIEVQPRKRHTKRSGGTRFSESGFRRLTENMREMMPLLSIQTALSESSGLGKMSFLLCTW